MCIFGAFSQIFGQQNTYLVGKYDFYVRCNNNTTKGMVASFEFPKTTQNEVTLNGVFIDYDNRPVNCSATFTYIDNSNIISVKTYMTTTYKPDFYRNDKFSIKMDDNDSGWVNMELGENYDAFCNLEGRIVKANTQLDDYYNIIFYAFGPTSLVPKSQEEPDNLELTFAGHLYVGFAKNGIIQKVKGFSPYTHNMPVSVNGKVNEKTDQSYLLGYHTHCFIVKVSKDQYNKALAINKEYYIAVADDCISYGDDVANLLALKTPNLSDMVLLPQGYLNFLIDNNREIRIMNELCQVKPKKSSKAINNPKLIFRKANGTVKTVQGSNLNLRDQPSDKATIINKIPDGTKIKIVDEDAQVVVVNGEKGKWLKIEYNGVIGWAWGKFIIQN